MNGLTHPEEHDLTPPLILTLLWAPDAQSELDGLRQRFFPPARNIVPAHLTLFHKLPGAHFVHLLDDIRAASAALAPLALALPGVRSLGRGVAIDVVSAELGALRAALARRWAAHLTPQDAQGFRPHVTIQNKVAPAEARRLLDDLRAGWTPRVHSAHGLQLWWYEGGPWRSAAVVRFGAPP